MYYAESIPENSRMKNMYARNWRHAEKYSLSKCLAHTARNQSEALPCHFQTDTDSERAGSDGMPSLPAFCLMENEKRLGGSPQEAA